MRHEFVQYIPEKLEEGVLYVAMDLGTVAHTCCCGCGNGVYTPLSPTDWELTYNGEAITLAPSIGNWNFDCQSHYWIINSQVKWSGKWTDKEIKTGRQSDRRRKEKHYSRKKAPAAVSVEATVYESTDSPVLNTTGFWSKIKRWFT